MNILIKAPDHFRDALLFLPVLKKIKSHYESVHITLLAGSNQTEIYKNIVDYDEIIHYGEKQNFISRFIFLLKQLKNKKFDFYLVYQNRFEFSWLGLIKRIPQRVCESSSLIDRFFYNHLHRIYRQFAVKHEVYYNLDLAESLGLTFIPDNKLKVNFNLNSELISQKTEILEKYQLADKKYILIHLDAGEVHPYWSSRNFARFMRRIHDLKLGYHFVIYGNEADKKYRLSFHDQLTKEKYKYLSGNYTFVSSQSTDLKDVLILIKEACVVLGHNSHVTHLKELLNGKAIIFFNLIRQFSPLRLAPFLYDAQKIKIILPQVVCGEIHSCSRAWCPYYSCMSKMVVGDVVNSFKKLENI